MRPAGGDRRSPQKVRDGQTDVRKNIIVVSDGQVVNTRVVPLSAEEFSLMTVPKTRVPTEEGSDGSGNCVPSREMHGGVVRRPSGLVSWIDAAHPEGVPTLPVLGASMMGRTTQGSSSIADEGVVLSEIALVRSAQFCRNPGLVGRRDQEWMFCPLL